MNLPKRQHRHFDPFAFGLSGAIAGIVGLSLMGLLMSGYGIIYFTDIHTKKVLEQFTLIVICLSIVGGIITWIVGSWIMPQELMETNVTI